MELKTAAISEFTEVISAGVGVVVYGGGILVFSVSGISATAVAAAHGYAGFVFEVDSSCSHTYNRALVSMLVQEQRLDGTTPPLHAVVGIAGASGFGVAGPGRTYVRPRWFGQSFDTDGAALSKRLAVVARA